MVGKVGLPPPILDSRKDAKKIHAILFITHNLDDDGHRIANAVSVRYFGGQWLIEASRGHLVLGMKFNILIIKP